MSPVDVDPTDSQHSTPYGYFNLMGLIDVHVMARSGHGQYLSQDGIHGKSSLSTIICRFHLTGYPSPGLEYLPFLVSKSAVSGLSMSTHGSSFRLTVLFHYSPTPYRPLYKRYPFSSSKTRRHKL